LWLFDDWEGKGSEKRWIIPLGLFTFYLHHVDIGEFFEWELLILSAIVCNFATE
jgi:hypothetical protein